MPPLRPRNGLDQALHNDELTNSQLEAVARGFSATPRPADLAELLAAKYFEDCGLGLGQQDLPHG